MIFGERAFRSMIRLPFLADLDQLLDLPEIEKATPAGVAFLDPFLNSSAPN